MQRWVDPGAADIETYELTQAPPHLRQVCVICNQDTTKAGYFHDIKNKVLE